jgi:6-phosphogluconolactonase
MKFALLLAAATLFAAEQTVYVGTYTGNGSQSQGIYSFRFDDATGQMSAPTLAVESTSPSFLAVAKGGRFVYAVNEAGGGEVSAFAVDAPGKLRLLNKVSARGTSPCHLNFDRSGRWLAVANYGSGTVAIFPVQTNGQLGEAAEVIQHKGSSVNKNRQQGPHAHSVNFSRDGRYLYVADLGLDQVKIYSFNSASGKLTETAALETPKGAGPRHLALGPAGLLYVLNEMFYAVSVFRWTGGPATPALSTVKALPSDAPGNSGAEVLLHRSRKLLFSSNRGHDSISVYETDPATGSLKLLRAVPLGGKVPRGFVLSPDGKWLLAAAQNSDQIFAFRIDKKAQTLVPVGNPISVGRPVCLRFHR